MTHCQVESEVIFTIVWQSFIPNSGWLILIFKKRSSLSACGQAGSFWELWVVAIQSKWLWPGLWMPSPVGRGSVRIRGRSGHSGSAFAGLPAVVGVGFWVVFFLELQATSEHGEGVVIGFWFWLHVKVVVISTWIDCELAIIDFDDFVGHSTNEVFVVGDEAEGTVEVIEGDKQNPN